MKEPNPYGKVEESFDDFDEVKDNILRGGEIEFIYGEKHYGITPCDNGRNVVIYESCNEKSEFTVPMENLDLLGEYIIGGKKLSDIVPELTIIWRNF